MAFLRGMLACPVGTAANETEAIRRLWGYDAAGTEVTQLAARQLVLSNQQRYSSILRRGLSSKSREFVQKVLEGMQHDKKGTLPVCAGSVLDLP